MVRKRKWGVIPSWTSPDKSPDKETIESFTILTTEANGFLSDIHDRMPLILPKESWDFWLDSEITSAEPYQQVAQAVGRGAAATDADESEAQQLAQ